MGLVAGIYRPRDFVFFQKQKIYLRGAERRTDLEE
jgi:hypothetical protein